MLLRFLDDGRLECLLMSLVPSSFYISPFFIIYYQGPLNIMSPATFIIGATTYAWPFARSTAPLVIISIIYGFTYGAFVSLLPKPVMNLGDEGDIGRRVGMFLTVIAFGALAGPPISGAINKRTNGFEIVGTFAGE